MADITPIARIETPFAEKFGVPRQSGVADCPGRIVFEPPYRQPEALRGLEDFSHIWLIWQFDRALRQDWSPTVRPPRLGGNARMGVFATRSPFRPNGLGLSSVALARIEWDTPEGPVLHVRGADLVSGTPIFDIKPYLAYTDSHPEAAGGGASGGILPGGAAVRRAAGAAGGPAVRTGQRPPAPVSGRPPAGLRHGLRRTEHPLPRGGRRADRSGHRLSVPAHFIVKAAARNDI